MVSVVSTVLEPDMNMINWLNSTSRDRLCLITSLVRCFELESNETQSFSGNDRYIEGLEPEGHKWLLTNFTGEIKQNFDHASITFIINLKP